MADLQSVPDARARREQVGLTQVSLAERAGVSLDRIQAVERGVEVRPRTANAIEAALVLAALPAVEDAAPRTAVAWDRAELAVFGELVVAMERLTDGGRRRALAYLADRFEVQCGDPGA